MSEADFHGDLQMIQAFDTTARASDLVALADRLHSKWSKDDSDRYGEVMAAVLECLLNRSRDNESLVAVVSNYAELTLKRGDLMALRTEAELVRLLDTPLPSEASSSMEQSARAGRRRIHAGHMIHVVARVQKGKDDSWGRKDWPRLNVSPPAATRLKAGVSPAAIADPVLRAAYEAALDENRQKAVRSREQRQIRNLERSFLPWAQERLVSLYADGGDVSEVVGLCDEWGADPAWRDGVVESLQEPTK